ncbi:SJCHGC02811 protein, related [Neospora caninum Liverpool]|uniref:SJCHGC02811 protein, related n=1 Tax=Neospora caninum (strain Liverpool) TaxID=572307 RepID=F0VHA8_NEOCL|nr:SJCHGC02811 protein, related [Neospora caninum Liverpool]CBZ53102.1 SJCHGC02811 protein, related [Neospora caninum Liverpool]CEL67087.1 TPA: SJCHGC02811 protein, related [Neospora caninum Liverpool]|eukprot:XP_003883134.1 SJCHGC02811 protein, related [Neospora caninum Liverpool]
MDATEGLSTARDACEARRKKSLKKKKPRLILTKHPLGLLPSGNALFVSSGASRVVERSASLGSLAALDDATLLVFLSTLAEFAPLSALLSLSSASKYLLAALLDEELWQSLLLSRLQPPGSCAEARGALGAQNNGVSPIETPDAPLPSANSPLKKQSSPRSLPDSSPESSTCASSPLSAARDQRTDEKGVETVEKRGCCGEASATAGLAEEREERQRKDATCGISDFTWRGTWKLTYLRAERERIARQRTPRAAGSFDATDASSASGSPGEDPPEMSCLDSSEAGNARGEAPLPVLQGVCSDTFFQRWLCATVDVSSLFYRNYDTLERVPASELSVEEFVERYEKPNKPVVITDLVSRWPAFGKWNEKYLRRHFGDVRFNAGAASNIRLETFYQYAGSNFDEAPLFIFDPRFAESTRDALASSSSSAPLASSRDEMGLNQLDDDCVRSLAEDYEVPPYFADSRDLFACLGKRRPNFRWMLVGNCRSGSKWHVDPNQTSAWNAVVKGCKRWILLPPTVCPPGVFPSPDGGEVTQPVSLVEWLMNYYFDALHAPGYPYTGGVAPIEGSVREGEVIFVPQGWWHCVLNEEDDTIAVTQNFVSPVTLQNVRSFLHYKKDQISGLCTQGRHETFASEFDAAVGACYPELLPVVSSPPPPCTSSSSSSSSSSSVCRVASTASREEIPGNENGEGGGREEGRDERKRANGESRAATEGKGSSEGPGGPGTKRKDASEETGGFWERLKKRRRPMVLGRGPDGEASKTPV